MSRLQPGHEKHPHRVLLVGILGVLAMGLMGVASFVQYDAPRWVSLLPLVSGLARGTVALVLMVVSILRDW